jgi:6-phosphogluconolactonase (cycloisomerase 2 family)
MRLRSVLLLSLLGMSANAATTGFLYGLTEHDSEGNHLYGYAVNETSGELTQLPGFPLATGGDGLTSVFSVRMVIDQANARLYVVNTKSVTAYGINRDTGALSELAFSPISLGSGVWIGVVVDPTGQWLITIDGNGGKLTVFQIAGSSATGTDTSFNPKLPYSAAFSQDGSYLYTGGNVGTGFYALGLNASTGALSNAGTNPVDSGASFPEALATDAAGRLFVSHFSTGQLQIYTTVSGVPTEVSHGPFSSSGLFGAISGVLHPAGYYYVADRLGAAVGAYQISGSGASTTLSAVNGQPFSAQGSVTEALALNLGGDFLFAANGASHNITTYSVNQGTGALTILNVQAAGTLGEAGLTSSLAYLPPSAGHLYVLKQSSGGANQLYGYAVTEASGRLNPLFGFPLPTGGLGNAETNSEQLAIDRVNLRLYAVNAGSNTLTAYAIDPASGVLRVLPHSPISLGTGDWRTIQVHPSGSPLVVGDAAGAALASFRVDATSAVAASGSPFSTGTAAPASAAFSQDGAYVYAGGATGSKLAGFSVEVGGVLTPLTGSPFESGTSSPNSLGTDVSGRLFTTSLSANQLRAYSTASGVPAGVTSNPFTAGLTTPVDGVVHPSGYYLVADRAGNQVGVYRITGAGMATQLTPVSSSPFASGGTLTNVLALNKDHDLLFAANGDSRNVTSFRIDPASGVLTALAMLPANAMGTAGELSGMAYTNPPAPPSPPDAGTPDGGAPDSGTPIDGPIPGTGEPVSPTQPASCHCGAAESVGALPLAFSAVLLRLAVSRRRRRRGST